MDKFLIKGNKRKKTSESTEEIATTEDVSPSKDVDSDYQAPIARSTESQQSSPSTQASSSGSDCRTKNLTDKEKNDILSSKWTEAFSYKFPARYEIYF
jgi:hypothetical protein